MTTLTRRGFALSNKHVSKDLYCCRDNRSRSLNFKVFQVAVSRLFQLLYFPEGGVEQHFQDLGLNKGKINNTNRLGGKADLGQMKSH